MLLETGLAVPWFRCLVGSPSPQSPEFNPRSVKGFVVDNMAVWSTSHQVLQFSPVSVIPPMLHSHSFLYHWCYIIIAVDSNIKQSTYRHDWINICVVWMLNLTALLLTSDSQCRSKWTSFFPHIFVVSIIVIQFLHCHISRSCHDYTKLHDVDL